jgi:oligopeptide transport system permease protein
VARVDPVIRTVARRLAALGIVLVAVATASFLLLHAAPGGPFATDQHRSAAVERALAARYHTGDPIWQQYLDELVELARGDLGRSMVRDESVAELVSARFPVSALIGALALGFAIAAGVAAGTLAAWRGGWVDRGVRAAAAAALCVPAFVAGPALVVVVSLRLGWLPPARVDGASGYVLPALTLGLFYAGAIARLSRGGMVDALAADYIRTARAKGLAEHAVVWRHALRVAIAPAVSYLGPAAAAMLCGSFAVEMIFQVPGLGRTFVDAIATRDAPVLTGVFVFYAALIAAIDMVVDVVLVALDPRRRSRP